MSDVAWAFGIQLQMGDGGSPEAFTALAEGVTVTPYPETMDVKEVTNHDSPGGREEFIPTILRSGECVFEGNYVPGNATHQNARSAMLARTKKNWKLIFPDLGAEVDAFAGYIVGYVKNPHTTTDQQMLTITIKVTGEPTVTY